jgi:YD repeat-containing protein
MDLPIPATTPNHVWIRVEIDRVLYHSDRDDRAEMRGVQTSQEFIVVPTTYTGRVTAVTPEKSRGVTPILITGRAWMRSTRQAAPNVPMLVKIANGGFERTENVLTDTNGLFSTTFQPLETEPGGIYSVWAVHPDLNDRTVQASFAIERVLASPARFTVKAPHYYTQSVPLIVTAGPGTVATNLHLACLPEDQPGGVLPRGVTLDLAQTLDRLEPNALGTLAFAITGTPDAPRQGDLVLRLSSNPDGADPWQRISLAYEFSEPNPILRWTPNYLDTGVAPGSGVTEQFVLQNVGVVAATGLSPALLDERGAPAPAWATLTTPASLPDLAAAATATIALNFQPPASTVEGDYHFILRIAAANHPNVDLRVHVAVVTSGKGGLLFRVIDMYTGQSGNSGVRNARIELRNDRVSSFLTNLVSDINGEAQFHDLPIGLYAYRVTADNHQGANGMVWVRPGAVAVQQVVLTYNLVTVQWQVVPITIEDRYEIVLTAKFETDVPAAEVTIAPPMVNLPQLLAGDVYRGEFLLQNHGTIAAEHFKVTLPSSDQYVSYELLAAVPERLEARQSFRLPYRLVCVKSMPGPRHQGAASRPLLQAAARKGGDGETDCLEYDTSASATFDYQCANGSQFDGSANAGYHYAYLPGCGGNGDSAGTRPGYNYEPPQGSSSSPPETDLPSSPGCFPDHRCSQDNKCDTTCCDQNHSSGSWVNLLAREYQDEIEDLRIKVPGGHAKVVRQFYRNWWSWSELARVLYFSPKKIDSIVRNLVSYAPAVPGSDIFQYRGNRIYKLEDGFRWENKDGEWESYDARGRLLASGRRGTTVLNYLYDAAGKLTAQADAQGRIVIAYEYGGPRLDQLVRVSDSAGRQVLYRYNSRQALAAVVDALGNETTYSYADASGQLGDFSTYRLVEKHEASGKATYIEYNSWGIIESVLDQDGNGAYYGFFYVVNTGEYGCSVRTTSAQTMVKMFDAAGRVNSQDDNGTRTRKVIRSARTEVRTDISGAETYREYDDFGNVVQETRPDGGVKRWEYDPLLTKPTRIHDPNAAITLLAYDANANLTNKIEAAGTPIARTNRWLYNDQNQLLRRIDARGNKTDYADDEMGNLVREFDPDNPAYSTGYAYDSSGNRVAQTNALGYVTRYAYDALGRLIAETNALGYVTLNTYAAKNLVEVETGRDGAARGRIVRYRYDPNGRRTATVRIDDEGAEHVWETTTYDPDGRVIATANALGQTTHYEYDVNGRQVKVARPFSATETAGVGRRARRAFAGRLSRLPVCTKSSRCWPAVTRRASV